MESKLTETLKIVIPMAGLSTRMRPHTWSKPRLLISVAGKPSLDHLLDMFAGLSKTQSVEYVFIISPYLGEQIPPYIAEHHSHIKAHFVLQPEMKGQSHALWLAGEYLHGPLLICFADTLMETDFSFLAKDEADGVAWVTPVPDPRRFGVAELNKDGWVKLFIEKPQSIDNNLAAVGCYYFKSAERLLADIEEQFRRSVTLKNEYFLADAISIMIEGGARVRTQTINTWLDTGTIEATLDTNRSLLAKQAPQVHQFKGLKVEIIEPVSISPSAEISDSTIGPFASIGANCRISNSRITDSIIEADCEIRDAVLSRSLIGRQAKIQGQGADIPLTLNIGDNSNITMQ
jgi:glucose-1-phosphate thymidylyltransferase